MTAEIISNAKQFRDEQLLPQAVAVFCRDSLTSKPVADMRGALNRPEPDRRNYKVIGTGSPRLTYANQQLFRGG